jgi:hypothetical protein
MFDKTVKAAYLIDGAIPNSHNFHSIITEKLQKNTVWKEEQIWELNAVHIVPVVQSTTGTSPKNYMTA